MPIFSIKLLPPIMLLGFMVTTLVMNACAEETYEGKRRQMLTAIQQTVETTESYTGKASLNKRVIEAMITVPRHEFVPLNVRSRAYENRALPISHEQTISQPYIVALMTDLAAVTSESIVLEVGTGSGYQAAVLSEVVKHVYSIEIIEPLGKQAKLLLQELGYDNITLKIGDGYYGWPKYAPFDAILVTAAAEHVPQQLIQQLKPGGRLVIPVDENKLAQSLMILTKGTDGEIEQRDVLPVAFVPLTGEH